MVRILVFTGFIECTLCRVCSHTFVRFQTVLLFVSVTESAEKISLFPFFYPSLGNPTYFFHLVINVSAMEQRKEYL